MLSSPHRMRRSADFTDTVRAGRRIGSRRLVVHAHTPGDQTPAAPNDATPTLVGFVVSKAVGGSVVRNQVKRRLREQMRPRLAALPMGSKLVVRALPGASSASSADLARDLDRALERLVPGTSRTRPAQR